MADLTPPAPTPPPNSGEAQREAKVLLGDWAFTGLTVVLYVAVVALLLLALSMFQAGDYTAFGPLLLGGVALGSVAHKPYRHAKRRNRQRAESHARREVEWANAEADAAAAEELRTSTQSGPVSQLTGPLLRGASMVTAAARQLRIDSSAGSGS